MYKLSLAEPAVKNPDANLKRKFPTSNFLIIIFLAFLLYKYSVKPLPEISQPVVQKPVEKPTKIIAFAPPDILTKTVQSGSCWENSVAYPFRQDAWRCMIENNIIDPCFSTKQSGYVFCQTSPLKEESFLIKLTI